MSTEQDGKSNPSLAASVHSKIRKVSPSTVSILTDHREVGYNALVSAIANYGLVQGVEPWAARLSGDQIFEEYFQHFRALQR